MNTAAHFKRKDLSEQPVKNSDIVPIDFYNRVLPRVKNPTDRMILAHVYYKIRAVNTPLIKIFLREFRNLASKVLGINTVRRSIERLVSQKLLFVINKFGTATRYCICYEECERIIAESMTQKVPTVSKMDTFLKRIHKKGRIPDKKNQQGAEIRKPWGFKKQPIGQIASRAFKFVSMAQNKMHTARIAEAKVRARASPMKDPEGELMALFNKLRPT